MEFVDPDDEPGPRSPLPPEDRLWRHPSELGVGATGAVHSGLPYPPALDGPDQTRRPSLWLVAAVSAVSAGLLATGLSIVVFGLVGASDRIDPVVERQMEPRPIDAVSQGGVADAAQEALDAVVQVREEGTSAPLGSAVVFRSDGHMLTSASVVGEAGAVRVRLDGGTEIRGRVVGADPDTDIAVVKIDGGPYATAVMGTAADTRVGQQVIAFGRSSTGPSVTVGVVSALHRSVPTSSDGRMLFDMMQTDAQVPSGWPGGALLDVSGSVIGIAAPAGTTVTGQSGFAFAVPIDVARWVASHIIDTGQVPWVWLGVEGGDLDGPTAAAMEVNGGALVTNIMSGSPAYRVGLSPHDVIVAVQGEPVTSMAQLVVTLRAHEPGDAVLLDVVRHGERMPIEVVLVQRPDRA